MSNSAHRWPSDLWSADEVRTWIESHVGEAVFGPDDILWSKQWGVTARFTARSDRRHLVLKASRHPAAAHGPRIHEHLSDVAPGLVPAFLAGSTSGADSWTLFEHVDGVPLEANLDTAAFARLASALGRIQGIVATTEVPADVPRSPLAALTSTLSRVRDAGRHHLPTWEEEGSGPESVESSRVDRALGAIEPRVGTAVSGLMSHDWPASVDHVDANVSNAIEKPSGGLVVIDWEEAVVGHPAMSLDRLLDDAADHDGGRGGPTSSAVIDAWLAAVPWDTSDGVAVVETATRLNRIAFAGQALEFWRARGREHGHPALMAFCVDRIIEAWAP